MEKKCLIVKNCMSGNSEKLNSEKLLKKYEKIYDVTIKEIKSQDDFWDSTGFDVVVVCGGDGTFNYALNNKQDESELIYYPCGTFNESAKCKLKNKDYIELKELGMIDNNWFSYVTAVGSFTNLGYAVDSKQKQRIKILAYLLKVVKSYKVFNIKAKIDADGKLFDDNFTLIMAIDSKRCFGFQFNKLYKDDDGLIQLLLIKSPGKNNLLNKIKIFFPLFKAFFIGLRKEQVGKYLTFLSVKDVKCELKETQLFNIDGEAKEIKNNFTINVRKPKNKIFIANTNIL